MKIKIKIILASKKRVVVGRSVVDIAHENFKSEFDPVVFVYPLGTSLSHFVYPSPYIRYPYVRISVYPSPLSRSSSYVLDLHVRFQSVACIEHDFTKTTLVRSFRMLLKKMSAQLSRRFEVLYNAHRTMRRVMMGEIIVLLAFPFRCKSILVTKTTGEQASLDDCMVIVEMTFKVVSPSKRCVITQRTAECHFVVAEAEKPRNREKPRKSRRGFKKLV